MEKEKKERKSRVEDGESFLGQVNMSWVGEWVVRRRKKECEFRR